MDEAVAEGQTESSQQELKKLPETIGGLLVRWEEAASFRLVRPWRSRCSRLLLCMWERTGSCRSRYGNASGRCAGITRESSASWCS